MSEVAKARAAASSLAAQGRASSKAGGKAEASSRPAEFLPAECFTNERDELRTLPEVPAVALLVGSLSKYLHMRECTMEELETALLHPTGNDLMAVILSRLLLRDKALRDALGKDEGMDWGWINSFFRATTRSWFMRHAALAELVDTLAQRCKEEDEEAAAAAPSAAAPSSSSVHPGARPHSKQRERKGSGPAAASADSSSEGRGSPHPGANGRAGGGGAGAASASPGPRGSPRLDRPAGASPAAASPRTGPLGVGAHGPPGSAPRPSNSRRSGMGRSGGRGPAAGGADATGDASSGGDGSDSEEGEEEEDGASPRGPPTDPYARPSFGRDYDPGDYEDDLGILARGRAAAKAPMLPTAASSSAAATAPPEEAERGGSEEEEEGEGDDEEAAAGSDGGAAPPESAVGGGDPRGPLGRGPLPSGRKRKRNEVSELTATVLALHALPSGSERGRQRDEFYYKDAPLTALGLGGSRRPRGYRSALSVSAAAMAAAAAAAAAEEGEGAPDGPTVEDINRWLLEGPGRQELMDAMVDRDMRAEADEDEVNELHHWAAVLAKLCAATNGPAPSSASPADAPESDPLPPARDPLAHAFWGQLPIGARVALLMALLEARACTEGDDINAAVRSLGSAMSDPEPSPPFPPLAPGSSGPASPPLLLRDAPPPPDGEDPLRLRLLGASPARGGLRFHTLPACVFSTDVRVYTEARVRLSSGRTATRWRTAAWDAASLSALIDSFGGEPGPGRGTADRRLLDGLVALQEGAGARAEALRLRLERAREREAKRELLAAMPRRVSSRTRAAPEGSGGWGASSAPPPPSAEQLEAQAEVDAAELTAFLTGGGSTLQLREQLGRAGTDLRGEPRLRVAAWGQDEGEGEKGEAPTDQGEPSDEGGAAAVATPISSDALISAPYSLPAAAPPGKPTGASPAQRGRKPGPMKRSLPACLAGLTPSSLMGLLPHLARNERVRAIGELVLTLPEWDRFPGWPASSSPDRPTSAAALAALSAAYSAQLVRERDRVRRRGKDRSRAAREAAAEETRRLAAEAEDAERTKRAREREQVRAARVTRRNLGLTSEQLDDYSAGHMGDLGPGEVLQLRFLQRPSTTKFGGPADVVAYFKGSRTDEMTTPEWIADWKSVPPAPSPEERQRQEEEAQRQLAQQQQQRMQQQQQHQQQAQLQYQHQMQQQGQQQQQEQQIAFQQQAFLQQQRQSFEFMSQQVQQEQMRVAATVVQIPQHPQQQHQLQQQQQHQQQQHQQQQQYLQQAQQQQNFAAQQQQYYAAQQQMQNVSQQQQQHQQQQQRQLFAQQQQNFLQQQQLQQQQLQLGSPQSIGGGTPLPFGAGGIAAPPQQSGFMTLAAAQLAAGILAPPLGVPVGAGRGRGGRGRGRGGPFGGAASHGGVMHGGLAGAGPLAPPQYPFAGSVLPLQQPQLQPPAAPNTQAGPLPQPGSVVSQQLLQQQQWLLAYQQKQQQKQQQQHVLMHGAPVANGPVQHQQLHAPPVLQQQHQQPPLPAASVPIGIPALLPVADTTAPAAAPLTPGAMAPAPPA